MRPDAGSQNANFHYGAVGILHIACDERKVVLQRGRGDDEIGLREGAACLAAILHQEPPSQHDVLSDCLRPFREHAPDFIREPLFDLGAAEHIG